MPFSLTKITFLPGDTISLYLFKNSGMKFPFLSKAVNKVEPGIIPEFFTSILFLISIIIKFLSVTANFN